MTDFGVTEKKRAALEARMRECGISEEDIEEKFIKGGGPGGQKVNKTASTVYIRHEPTGIEVKMSKERSQGLNRYYGRKRLCELVEERVGIVGPEQKRIEKMRKQKARRKRRSSSGGDKD